MFISLLELMDELLTADIIYTRSEEPTARARRHLGTTRHNATTAARRDGHSDAPHVTSLY